jgi:hypothetical protein
MEATYTRYVPAMSTSDSPPQDDKDKMMNPEIPEEQTVDRLAALEKELDASLSEFDEMLLKELETIQAKSAHKMRNLAREAAEAAKRLKGRGGDSDTQYEGSEHGENDESGSQDEASSQDEDDESNKTAASDEDGEDAGDIKPTDDNKNRTAERRGKGEYGKEDEDIVARQLREAAENETDPELKEQLWKEYDEYMKNTE